MILVTVTLSATTANFGTRSCVGGKIEHVDSISKEELYKRNLSEACLISAGLLHSPVAASKCGKSPAERQW